MAVINNPYIYSGGNAKFDSSPSVNLYAQLQAKKQAKDDALNQYFNELGGKINTAGVRTQDLDSPKGGIAKDIDAWRNNWMANKDAIKKGGMAQQQHMAQLQGIMRKIEQSKSRAKTELEIGKMKLEGKYDPDEDDIHVLDKIGRSIYDPESYKQDGVSEYGYGDLSPNIPDFDANKQSQFWTALTKNKQAGKVYDEANLRRDKITGNAIVPFKEIFSPEQIKQIGDEAADLVGGDKSARKYYNKILDDPQSEKWHQLNDAFQSVYGTGGIVSTPQQAAAADAILRASVPQKQGEETKSDWDLKNTATINKIFLNDSLIRSRGRGQGSENLDDYDVLSAYTPKVKTKTVTTVIPTANGGSSKVEKKVNFVPAADVAVQDKELIGKVAPYSGKDGDFYIVRDDGDWEGDEGQVIPRAKVARANMDRTNLSEVKRGALTLKPNQGTPKPPAKTKKDPLGLGL